MAWIVKPQSRDRRRPVFEKRDQPPIVQHWLGRGFGHIGYSEPVGRGFEHQHRMIERHHPGNVDGEFLPVPFEFPAIELAARQALPDAAVLAKIIGRFRSAGFCNISRSSHRQKPEVFSQRNRNHVLRYEFRKPDTRIKSPFDNVDQATFGHQVQRDIRVPLEKDGHDPLEQQTHAHLATIDPQGASDVPALLRHRVDGLIEVLKHRLQPLKQPTTRFGEADAAGRSMKEPCSEIAFEPGDRMAERRPRHTQHVRRLTEAAVLRHCRERGQVVQCGPHYWSKSFTSSCGIVDIITTTDVHYLGMITGDHAMSKTWLITGASSGLGRIMTEKLLARGDRVVGTARRTSMLSKLAAAHGAQFHAITLDLTDTAAIRTAIDGAFAHFGRINVVVSNAGYGLFGAAEELSDQQIDRQIATNLTGSIQLIRASLPHLRSQGGGRIVQVSSEGGQIAYPSFSLYHASKWGIEGFVEAVAKEVAAFGIDFIIAEPGPTGTNFGAALDVAEPAASYERTPAADVRRAIASGEFAIRGDAARTVDTIMAAADAEQPPFRLALGSTAYENIHAALTKRLEALELQREVAYSADREDS